MARPFKREPEPPSALAFADLDYTSLELAAIKLYAARNNRPIITAQQSVKQVRALHSSFFSNFPEARIYIDKLEARRILDEIAVDIEFGLEKTIVQDKK